MLNVPDPDTLIADRLSGQGPFVATDPFMAPESFGEPEPALLRAHVANGPPAPQPPRPEPERPPVEEPPAAKPPLVEPVREAEPDIPLRPRASSAGAPVPAPPPQNLESVFEDVRSEVSKQAGATEASEHLALARTYIDMGMQD